MKAIQIENYGGSDQLAEIEVAAPQRQPEQLLIKTHFAGVNFIDTYQRAGIAGYQKPLPLILGLEGCGEVIQADADSGFAPGDRVAWPFSPFSYAEQVLVAQSRVVRVPAAIPSDIAAAVMLQGMTAHYLAFDTFKITADSTALVHAGAGGVGLLLTQVIAALGARVIATTSNEEKAYAAKAAGAESVIGYEDFDARVKKLTDGEGVDVVYDGVGVATYEKSLHSLKRRGLLALYGAASGPVPPLDLQILNSLGSLFVTRPTLADYIVTSEQMQARADYLFDLIAQDSLKVSIFGSYPAKDAAIAHSDLESRKTEGKLLLSF